MILFKDRACPPFSVQWCDIRMCPSAYLSFHIRMCEGIDHQVHSESYFLAPRIVRKTAVLVVLTVDAWDILAVSFRESKVQLKLQIWYVTMTLTMTCRLRWLKGNSSHDSRWMFTLHWHIHRGAREKPPFKKNDGCFLMDDLFLLEKKNMGNLVDTNMSTTSHETVFFWTSSSFFVLPLEHPNCGGTLPPNWS